MTTIGGKYPSTHRIFPKNGKLYDIAFSISGYKTPEDPILIDIKIEFNGIKYYFEKYITDFNNLKMYEHTFCEMDYYFPKKPSEIPNLYLLLYYGCLKSELLGILKENIEIINYNININKQNRNIKKSKRKKLKYDDNIYFRMKYDRIIFNMLDKINDIDNLERKFMKKLCYKSDTTNGFITSFLGEKIKQTRIKECCAPPNLFMPLLFSCGAGSCPYLFIYNPTPEEKIDHNDYYDEYL